MVLSFSVLVSLKYCPFIMTQFALSHQVFLLPFIGVAEDSEKEEK